MKSTELHDIGSSDICNVDRWNKPVSKGAVAGSRALYATLNTWFPYSKLLLKRDKKVYTLLYGNTSLHRECPDRTPLLVKSISVNILIRVAYS